MLRPIQWARQSVTGRQVEADGSELRNLYAVNVATAGDLPKVPVQLYGTPGARPYLKVPAFAVGGEQQSVADERAGVYALLGVNSPTYGKRLFGISAGHQFFTFGLSGDPDYDEYDPFDGTTTLYTLPNANFRNFSTQTADRVTGPAKLATDGRRVIMALTRNVYMWDMQTENFVSLLAPVPTDTSAELPDQDWVASTWIDGYFLLAARNGQFFHSLLDSQNFDQLDFATAQAKPDGLVGMEVLNRRVYLFGEQSVEQWYNAGGSDFAFLPDRSQAIDIGCLAPATIARNPDMIVFLGSDGMVYAMMAGQVRNISNETVNNDIGRAVISKARGFTYTEEGHRFYSLILEFPDASRRNWTYDFRTGFWHERTQTTILSMIDFGPRRFLGIEGQPHIYDSRLDWPTWDGEVIVREAVTPRLHAQLQRATISSFQTEISLSDTSAGIARVVRRRLEPATQLATPTSDDRIGLYSYAGGYATLHGLSAELYDYDGASTGTFTLHADNDDPVDIAFGGELWWVLDRGGRVYAYDGDGEYEEAGSFDLDAGWSADSLRGITFVRRSGGLYTARVWVLAGNAFRGYTTGAGVIRDAASDVALDTDNSDPSDIAVIADQATGDAWLVNLDKSSGSGGTGAATAWIYGIAGSVASTTQACALLSVEGEPRTVTVVAGLSARQGTTSLFLLGDDEMVRAYDLRPRDTLLLEWSDDAKRTWRDGSREGQQLTRNRRYRWNRLGQFREGRHFRLTVDSERRVDVLGAYLDSTVAPD